MLTCLYERPMHPYEIGQTLRFRAKQESIRLNYGSLYGVVESLDRRRLIRAVETTREGKRPQRTVYEITDRGAVEMHETWLEGTRYLNMEHLREHKKEALRQAA